MYTDTMTFSLDLILVFQLLVIPVFLPLLVGLVTTRVTASGVKSTLLAALALVTSLVVEGVDVIAGGGVYDIGQALILALPTFFFAVSAHYGLLRPTGATGKAQAIGNTKASDPA